MSVTGIVATLIEIGEIKDNFVSTAAAFSEDTSNHHMTVPTNRRWFLFGGAITRDASQACNITINNASDDVLVYLGSLGAATGIVNYLGTTASNAIAQIPMFFPMKAGWYIDFGFAGAQGAGASISAIIIEVTV